MTAPPADASAPHELRYRVAGLLGAGLLSLLGATTRLRRLDAAYHLDLRRRGTPVVFVFWHAHLVPLIHVHRGEGIVTLVSDHADGEYLTRVIRHLGYGAVRGSTTRGGARGLRGLIRAARRGRDLALTPDGPRGPARVFKPGALAVAQATGLPVVPMAVAATRSWSLRSWDDLLVPTPLSTVCIAYGAPVRVAAGADRGELGTLAAELARRLDALERRAAEEVGR